MTLSRLRWFGIVAPIVLLTALWALLHVDSLLSGLHHFPGILIVFLALGAVISLFAFGMFAQVQRLEQRILEQNSELEQRNNEFAALLEVGRAASSSIELTELLDGATDAILDVTGADAAELWLRKEPGELVLAHHRGAASEAFAERSRLSYGEGLPGLAAHRQTPIVVRDVPNDDRFLRQRVKSLGFRTYCALPLLHRGEIVGVLGVASTDPGRLCGRREVALLEGIGERVATAIANSHLHERVLDGAVLEERLRIARELHDGLAQVLSYINTQTLGVKRLVSTGKLSIAADELDAMEKATRAAYGDVREAILGLRVSIPRQGLVPTLRRYLDEYEEMAETEFCFEADGIEALGLPSATEIQLVRIVQEALSNVRKHAYASAVAVKLAVENGDLRVEISDDGRGFDAESPPGTGWPRFGLQTMRERAHAVGGRFEIESRGGVGTTVRVSVPIDPDRTMPRHACAAR